MAISIPYCVKKEKCKPLKIKFKKDLEKLQEELDSSSTNIVRTHLTFKVTINDLQVIFLILVKNFWCQWKLKVS